MNTPITGAAFGFAVLFLYFVIERSRTSTITYLEWKIKEMEGRLSNEIEYKFNEFFLERVDKSDHFYDEEFKYPTEPNDSTESTPVESSGQAISVVNEKPINTQWL